MRHLVLTVALAACSDFNRGLAICKEHGGCASPLHLSVTSDAGRVQELPVLVSLERGHLANVTDPASQLRFVDDQTGEGVPFEVDHFDPDAGAEVWVRLPLLDGTRALTLFTGPTAGGAADAGAVWQGWDLVHHFNPGFDSSAEPHYGTSRMGVVRGAGIIGDAAHFSGTGDERVLFLNSSDLFDGWPAFTLSFWLFADYPSAAAITGEPGVLDKGGPLSIGRLVGQDLQIDVHFTGSGNDTYLRGRVSLRGWTYIVYSFDGSRLVVYVDGVEADSQVMNNAPQRLTAGRNELFLGRGNNPMTGSIDEVRVEQRARTAEWVYASWQAMTHQLVTVSGP